MRRVESVSCIKFVEIGRITEVSAAEPKLNISVPGKWIDDSLKGPDDEDGSFCNAEASVGSSPSAFMHISDACNAGRVEFPQGVSFIVQALLHVLGFQHEHARPDRDNHISMNWCNIPGERHGEFIMKPGVNYWHILNGNPAWYYQFDIMSITISSSWQSNMNIDENEPTMTKVNSTETWCKNRRMSPVDIARIQETYNCPAGLPTCEDDALLDEGKLCTCKGRAFFKGLKCGGCAVPKACAEPECIINATCGIPKTCAVPATCQTPKTCQVWEETGGWFISHRKVTVTDGEKCGWDEITNATVCGFENVTSSENCGTQNVTDASLCGTTTGHGSECGPQDCAEGEVEWIVDEEICGDRFVPCEGNATEHPSEPSANYATDAGACGWLGSATMRNNSVRCEA
jgi:hypothetical protein